jgi:hypothetical protein
MYRPVLAIDVEKYSVRDARHQLLVQNDLHDALEQAAKATQLDRELWHRQVRGDGELAVLPEGTNMPALVGDFPRELDTLLAELNDRRRRGPRLRVRLAIHHGTLTWAPFGPAGDAPVEVARLLDARPLRDFLALRPDRDVALVVSAAVYRDVVKTGFCTLDRTAFRPLRTRVKGQFYHGYLHWPELMAAEERVAE